MSKKSGLTIVEQTIMLVPEFENVVRKLEQLVNLCLCQACKTGRMITVRELPRTRSPGWSFLSFQDTNS